MKALIYSHGTRGDLQPYLALAYALNRAGHTATLVGPQMYASFAAAYGVRFEPLTDEGVKTLSRPDFRRILLNSDRPESEIGEYRKAREKIFNEVMPRTYPVMLQQLWDAARDGADIVIHSHHSRQVMHQIAEKLGVPHVLATLYPHFVASRRYPSQMGTFDARPDNLEQHQRAARQPLKPLLVDLISTWREKTLGLPPREGFLDFRHRADGSPAPVLHGFSPHVLETAPDWPAWVHTTGFWSLPRQADWQPSPKLLRFLEDGDQPPVFIGFGSLLGVDPEATGQLVIEAVRRTGVRALIVTGWGGISVADPPKQVRIESDVPYDWLFPRVRAAVHAGGPGTHNTALEAGIPQVSCPFHKDQVMWGNHLHDLGVAPPPVKQRDLTADALAAAVHTALTDADIARNADRLARKVAGENGAENAVRVLEEIQRESHSAPEPTRSS
ncbi:glycosyltransferase [Streptomyces sp. ME19-01-6]|uniref:glycosyltransferase n=1 Tax=Streptomyces sp. ME19-01-6 TaxID=3028686 RepID=UPI0029BD48F2|nr:glycosyltransferase [Streptomyces sp. ME19-01-6]MDX3225463.1 glycosyltransferase [Streptomyces sp. ME19-01-6]